MKLARRGFLLFGISLLVLAVFSGLAFSQSTTTGDVSGVVTDSTRAVIVNADVIARDENTGVVWATKTNAEGVYHFPLLQPGSYTLTVSSSGFQASTAKVQVHLGEAAQRNLVLQVAGTTTTVEVSGAAPAADTAYISTVFDSRQATELPNAGNDLTNIAQTAPGMVQNTQAGAGNFSSFGLPATSNLFTLNGQNANDPFVNLNFSGASGLMLGTNEVQEVSVVSNGYSGQYGQLAGAQVNYVTKSGGNEFHGNATYYWNGRILNANDYLNNASGTPRPFSNANQWASSLGGPIQKDKTFFFFNFEGIRAVLPTSSQVLIPSSQFQAATLSNLAANGLSQSIPFYQQMFSLWNNAPGASRAQANASDPFLGCGDPNFDPSAVTTLGPGVPCTLTYRSTQGTFTSEYTMSLRLDHTFSESDKIFGRIQADRGWQLWYADPINPSFDLQTTAPEYQGQLNWVHVLGANAVNEFKTSGSWYGAVFSNPNRAAALSAFPTTLQVFDGTLTTMGGSDCCVPTGHNLLQYQVVDDLSVTRGRHTFKFGVNYHRNDITDYDFAGLTAGFIGLNGLNDLMNGIGNFAEQSFPSRLSQPIALYDLGVYGEDQWRITPKLNLTLTLRADHNSNPVCQTNCFARLVEPFTQLAQNPNAASLPYNQVLQTGLHQAYPATDNLVWQPRFGFAWSPFANNKTVIRGGIGIFGDAFPAFLVDQLAINPPLDNTLFAGGLPLAPAQPGNLFQALAAGNVEFNNAFANGGTVADMNNIPGFFPPPVLAMGKNVRQPRYQEWNLQVQENIGLNTSLTLNYVGNHGIYEAIQNGGLNEFAPGVAGLPQSSPDAAFGFVSQLQSIGVSNYNGLVTTVRHDFSHGLEFQANYSWSHALDEVSNGGFFPFSHGTASYGTGLQDPYNVRGNYGNAEYDVRQYFSANYVWSDSLRHLFHWGPNAVFSGWSFSGNIFSRSGLPFTVVNSSDDFSLTNWGGPSAGAVWASMVGPTQSSGCGKQAAGPNGTPCLNSSGFASGLSASGFGNQTRNQFRGPGYFNTDLSVMKRIKAGERAEVGFGAQFFNLLNHPNFDQPVNDLSNPQFGMITRTVGPPTSPLGVLPGVDTSARMIQLKAQLSF